MQCLITEPRAWLFLANPLLSREIYWGEPEMEEQIQKGKRDRGISQGAEGPSPWLHSLESKGRAKCLSLQQP